MTKSIHFLGLDIHSGRPFPRSLERQELLASLKQKGQRPRPVRSTVEAGDLSEAGWGIVFSTQTDSRVRRALEPLIKWREEQVGSLYRELMVLPGETSSRFIHRNGGVDGPVVPKRLPYYLLLIGRPEEISWNFQMELSLLHAVGRLAFDTPEDYELYVRNLVEIEKESARESDRCKRILFYGPEHPGNWATEMTRRHLIDPLASSIGRSVTGLEIDLVTGIEATRDKLLGWMADGSNSLLFAAGHAAVFSPESPLLEEQQGGLISGEWSGRGAVPRDCCLMASDVPRDFGASGAMAVLFGCFTAGTPQRDSFSKASPGDRTVLARSPFVSRLPQRLLAHPDGGLRAVIGHIDRAWPHAFLDRGVVQNEIFEDFMIQVSRGERLGLAMESFAMRYATVATKLANVAYAPGDPEAAPPDTTDLWIRYNEARSLIVLGDPAVRMRGHG